MALSYDEMQQLFEQMGFKGFSMRPYAGEMEFLLSTEPEDNTKAYATTIISGFCSRYRAIISCWVSIEAV